MTVVERMRVLFRESCAAVELLSKTTPKPPETEPPAVEELMQDADTSISQRVSGPFVTSMREPPETRCGILEVGPMGMGSARQ